MKIYGLLVTTSIYHPVSPSMLGCIVLHSTQLTGTSMSYYFSCPSCSSSSWVTEGNPYVDAGLLSFDPSVMNEVTGCNCFRSLTEEDYPEAFALSQSSQTSSMSASVIRDQALAEVANSAVGSSQFLSNIGYISEGRDKSIFDAGRTPPFGFSFDAARSDAFWMANAISFLAGNVRDCEFVDVAIAKAISDEATVKDWSGFSPEMTFVVDSHKMISAEYRGVDAATMRGVVQGMTSSLSDLLAAEGQMVRCILSASSHRARGSLYFLWSYVIFRLGGASLLERPRKIFDEFNTYMEDAEACGVDQCLLESFRRKQRLSHVLQYQWGRVVEEIFSVRTAFLHGMEYNPKFCGLHPPGECIVEQLSSVIPDVNSDPMDDEFSYSPESSSDEESSDDEEVTEIPSKFRELPQHFRRSAATPCAGKNVDRTVRFVDHDQVSFSRV